MLILLTVFHTLHIFLVKFNRFPELSRTNGPFPGLSSPGKCHNKILGLSRFSRTRTNPDKYISFVIRPAVFNTGFPQVLSESISLQAIFQSIICLRTFALIVSAHPYCARKFTCHVIHRARALGLFQRLCFVLDWI